MTPDKVIRCVVSGELKTVTPLCIGSGDVESRRINDREVEVSLVAKDHQGNPMIPGSSLKGCLRSFAESGSGSKKNIPIIFGSGLENNETGGHVIFSDAFLDRPKSKVPLLFSDNKNPAPLFWDEKKFTYIRTGNAISRQTGTTEEHMLYQNEIVPAGTVFSANFYCENIPCDALDFLLILLEQFNRNGGIQIGSDTAKKMGRMEWVLFPLTGFTFPDQIVEWIYEKQNNGFFNLPGLDKKGLFRSQFKPPRTSVLVLKLALNFEGPFMVNDPSSIMVDKNNRENSLAHTGLKNEDGKPVLKGTSFHGALRNQAEKIVRTVAAGKKQACYVLQKNRRCSPLNDISGLDSLCMTCRLFGGTGWKTPLAVSDFTLLKGLDSAKVQQDFVAIDRFTGGGAETRKFNARYHYKPIMEGRIELDLSRIKPAHAGLIVFVLRDLLEGDIPMGFGKTKGFGALTAQIKEIILPETLPCWVSVDPENSIPIRDTSGNGPNAHQLDILKSIIDAFEKEITS